MSEGSEYLKNHCLEALKTLAQVRDNLAHGDACFQAEKEKESLDMDVLMCVIDINSLIQKVNRIIYNCEEDLVSIFKRDPQRSLEDMRQDRAIKNMLFDFVTDIIKTDFISPKDASIKELNDFIHFWVKSNFMRPCDEQGLRDKKFGISLETIRRRYTGTGEEKSCCCSTTSEISEGLETELARNE